MFGFGKSDKDPFADPKSAARWLADLPTGDPLALHQALVPRLTRLAAADAKRTPAGLEAVFLVDAQAQGLRKTLTAQYATHARRSTKIEDQLWHALFDLTRAFLTCYGAYARDIEQQPPNAKWQELLPELIGRQMQYLGLDARIRLYHCEPWIPARWVEFFALFGAACAQQVERKALLLDPASGPTTIEHEFIVTLALERMQPGSLAGDEIEWLASNLHDWCLPLRLTLEPATAATFYVDLAGRGGLKRRNNTPLEGRVLFVDTRPLHAVMQQNIAALDQKIREEPLAPETERRRERLAMFTKLASRIDPEFRPIPRRSRRIEATGTLDAVVGFTKISACLHDEMLGVLNEDAGRSFSGAMELAVFGRARSEPTRLRQMAERRLVSYVAAGGPWDVKNVSETGFRMIAPAAGANGVTLGTLVALRLREQDRWVLCIVRRMTKLTAERAEIGLEIIASSLVGVELAEQRKFADAGYSVDGEQAMINGRTFRGLLLAIPSRPGATTAVHSLVVPSIEYQPAKRFEVRTPRTSFPVRLGRQLDQQSDWAWAAIESEFAAASDDLSGSADSG